MKKILIFSGIAIITMIINIIFGIVSRVSVSFSEWYAMNVYPLIVGVLGRAAGIFPFAVVEILLYIFIAAAVFGIVFLIIKLVKNKERRLKYLLRTGLTVCCAASCLLMFFLFGCGINYQRRPFSYHSGLEIQMYSEEDLRGVLLEVIDELRRITPLIQTNDDGVFVLDKSGFNDTAREAMRNLAEIYPALDTYYPKPKPVLLSKRILSPLRIRGIFSPFTTEALYNADMPDSEKPFTALHELSHLSGFMREDEANFIAFLACRESGDVGFLYSGYINALSYLMRAYDGDDIYDIAALIPEQVFKQYAAENEYWQSFYNAPGGAAIAAISSAVNDTYLKAQGQRDGVKSYGRVVDLLIADYVERKNA